MHRNSTSAVCQRLLWIAVVCSSPCFAEAQFAPDPNLKEENTVLLWNPGDSESAAIAQAYLAVHPNVIKFSLEDDLPEPGILYNHYPPNSVTNPLCCDIQMPPYDDCNDCPICAPQHSDNCLCCSCPSFAVGVHLDTQGQPRNWAMDKYYITPEMYEQWIAQPLREFLIDYATTYPGSEGYEPILAIATTRGVPATISQSFDSAVNHDNLCIHSSLESRLAALNFAGKGNPYGGHLNKPFKTWINTEVTECNPDGGLAFKGKIFLVSRLDSDRRFNSNSEPYGTHTEAVIALVNRSANLTINKFACTLVIDVNAGIPSELARKDGNFMRSRRWCVFYEADAHFLHGAFYPQENEDCGGLSQLEYQYVAWPELVHSTIGRHSIGEPVCSDYVKHYWPHPAGLFLSYESYNGIALRHPNYPPASVPPAGGWAHGSVLQWIGRGGSFTIGGVNGWDSSIRSGENAIANLYEYGLSWAEAAWSDLDTFNSFACPIGDPLARVIVHDPDLNNDGRMDSEDLALFVLYLQSQDPLGDINQDGLINQDDLSMIEGTLGRNAYSMPQLPAQTTPWPPQPMPTANMCGDISGNSTVNQGDLDLFDQRIATCGYQYSGIFDVNHDLQISPADRVIIAANANPPRCLYDANLSGCINPADVIAVQDFLDAWGPVQFPNVHWIADFDVNCDQWIDREDVSLVQSAVNHPSVQCPGCSPP